MPRSTQTKAMMNDTDNGYSEENVEELSEPSSLQRIKGVVVGEKMRCGCGDGRG